MGTIDDEVAECVGLWLAEGSQNSKAEITFTNNCFELVELFNHSVDKLFNEFKYNKRIYVYTPDGSKPKIVIGGCQINYYVHKRATKPYFIFRVASVEMVKEWKRIVHRLLMEESSYSHILRGFFAGEGNIHGGKRGVRIIRISQKERKDFIDKLLDSLNLTYNFTSNNRMYNISNKRNWDIFAKDKIADLHPKKKDKFWKLYNSYKEEHYNKFHLKNKLLEIITNPTTSKDLANLLNRSQARVSEVLVDLKKEGKAINYRVRSKDFWTSNKDIKIISTVKNEYLNFLENPKQTSDFAKHFKVNWKSSSRRLKELQQLGLVKIEKNGQWIKTQTTSTITVI